MKHLTLAVVAAAIWMGTLGAQDSGEDRSPAEFTVGLDFTNQYIDRGFIEENDDLIMQPWMEGSFRLFEGDGIITEGRLNVEWWNSLHTGETGTGGDNSSPELWYESRISGGGEVSIADVIDLGMGYRVAFSPNGYFEAVHEIEVEVGLDDKELFGTDVPFFGGLNPYALLSFQVAGVKEEARYHDTGTYLEFGMEPTLNLMHFEGDPVTLSVPIKHGHSLGDFYELEDGEDDFFGYLDIGVEVSAPAGLLVSPFTLDDSNLFPGLRLTGSAHWVHMGDNLSDELNTPFGGEPSEWVIMGGFTWTP